MLKHLLPLIPSHTCYVEVFAGGLATLFAKPRSPMEIINDINGELLNFYRFLAAHPGVLADEIARIPQHRGLFKELLGRTDGTDLQRAVRFTYLNWYSFGASMASFAVGKTHSKKVIPSLELLHAASPRLNGVVIEQLDYERLLRIYDHEETFFFMDPPYEDAKTATYDGWSQDQLIAFRDKVMSLRAKWLVTLNDSPFVRELFAGSKFQALTTFNGTTKAIHRARFGEVIITPQ